MEGKLGTIIDHPPLKKKRKKEKYHTTISNGECIANYVTNPSHKKITSCIVL